jgi:hypothetical protein
MKCCLGCTNEMFLTYKSHDLGDREYPICHPHMMEFTKDNNGMLNLKSLLRGLPMESDVTPTAPPVEPKGGDDEWEPEL